MTSKDFFKEVKLEWCASEQQDKPLLNDMMKFAKLYHKEQLILSGVIQQRELLIDFSMKTHGNLLWGWKKEDSEKLVDEYQKGNL